MNIQTFSIVTGGTACNARCPFCVSRMTGDMDVKNTKPSINRGTMIFYECENGYRHFVLQAEEECPNCRCGTLEKNDDELCCRGECGTIYNIKRTVHENNYNIKRTVHEKTPEVNWRNFEKACELALRGGATTAMLTGKGEPLLWANLITEYIQRMRGRFPIVELQTNGLLFQEDTALGDTARSKLDWWYRDGLTTIGISVVHWLPEKNKEIYTPGREYMDLPELIYILHGCGFTVRLCCVMAKGYIDDYAGVIKMINFASENHVEQLTFNPVSVPALSEDDRASQWANEHFLDPFTTISGIITGLELDGAQEIMRLPHGARVFDYGRQNVCFNNCLSPDPEDLGSIRNLIFFPDGRIRYKWDSEASIIF